MATRYYQTSALHDRKEKNRIKLCEKYNGKKDLLAAWEEHYARHPDQRDDNHLYDLRRRVKNYALDLAYRGDDSIFLEDL